MSGSGGERCLCGTILLKRIMLWRLSSIVALVLSLIIGKQIISVLRRPSGNVRAKLVKDLQTYSFLDNNDDPTFLHRVNPNRITKTDVVSIDYAHRHGLMHIGAVILVTDARGDILLLKRAPHLATCPGSWGVLGEHSIGDEEPLDNAKRGVLEELGRKASHHVSFNQLTKYPIYMERNFSLGNEGRVDKQLLYVWEARIDISKEGIQLDLDKEVADHQWISLDGYIDWIDQDLKKLENVTRDFCCDTVAKIRQFEAGRLKWYRGLSTTYLKSMET